MPTVPEPGQTYRADHVAPPINKQKGDPTMRIRMKSPSALADKMTLMLEPVLTTVEREFAWNSYDRMMFTQEFEGSALSLTRTMNLEEKFDRAVLDLEGRALGLAGSCTRRGLRRLARHYTGRHRMAVVEDGQGGWLVVLAKVKAQVRRLLLTSEKAFGPQPAVRRAGSEIMKTETLDSNLFPRWTVQGFHRMTQATKYVHDRRGERVDVQYEEFWIGFADIPLTRTFSWMDEDDRRRLQVEDPSLKNPEDVESLLGLDTCDRFFLHAIDASGRPTLIALDVLDNYGIYPDDCDSRGYVPEPAPCPKGTQRR